MTIKRTDLVTYNGHTYSLADLAHYMDADSREALHSSWYGSSDDHQGWWDEYARLYPKDAAHVIECAPRLDGRE